MAPMAGVAATTNNNDRDGTLQAMSTGDYGLITEMEDGSYCNGTERQNEKSNDQGRYCQQPSTMTTLTLPDGDGDK